MTVATHRWAARLAVLVAVLATSGAPAPASAHTGSGATSSDYAVSAQIPPGAGVTVTVGPGGQWVQVTPAGAATVAVLDSAGRAFVRWRDGRVQADTASETAVAAGLVRFDERARALQAAGPGATTSRWVTVRAADTLRWSDARVDPTRPPGPAPSGGDQAEVTLPLLVDGARVPVTVQLRHVPGPSPLAPLAGVGLLAGLVGWAGGGRRGRGVLVAASAVAGVVTAVHIVGATLAASAGQGAAATAGSIAVGFLCWPFAVAAVVAGRRGSEHAPFLHLLTGATVLIVGGPSDAASMWRSQLVFAGPSWVDRGLVVIAFGVGLGLVVGGYRALARASRQQSPAPTGHTGPPAVAPAEQPAPAPARQPAEEA